jgi:hypothetical protein
MRYRLIAVDTQLASSSSAHLDSITAFPARRGPTEHTRRASDLNAVDRVGADLGSGSQRTAP